ncbi:hypothetical protein CRUP_012564 [Coryphaenoides rupestris]|nr:hypothetical protein CRUP_012564 [Coryphaenoides rupestris]
MAAATSSPYLPSSRILSSGNTTAVHAGSGGYRRDPSAKMVHGDQFTQGAMGTGSGGSVLSHAHPWVAAAAAAAEAAAPWSASPQPQDVKRTSGRELDLQHPGSTLHHRSPHPGGHQTHPGGWGGISLPEGTTSSSSSSSSSPPFSTRSPAASR